MPYPASRKKERLLPGRDNLTALFHLCFNTIAFKNGTASPKGKEAA